jgi:RND family efflux transporter MFP subunit
MFNMRLAALLSLATFSTVGCGPSNEYQAGPPQTVTVAHPIQRPVTLYLEETGTTEAVQLVEVRARVRGFLNEVLFSPGSDVKEGDVLYRIEKTQFEAAVAAAKAQLAAANVELNKAEIELKRQEDLFAQNATAETKVVAAKAARDDAAATIQAAQAQLDRANLDLEYTDVTAAIDGRVGKTLVKQGNLVDGTEATHLTTIIKYDPIYANFNINERQLLSLVDAAKKEESESDGEPVKLELELRRANDEGFPFKGEFDYADLAVDQSTGTFMIRGIFPNEERKIVPGLFVRVRIPLNVRDDAILVPEYAVASDQAGRYVLVTTGENLVERRGVTVGPRQMVQAQPFVVIDKGLTLEDLVIINGMQRARAGVTVTPNERDLNSELAKAGEATPTDAG